MLTLQKTIEEKDKTVFFSEKDIEEILSKEWLLTNDCGGYASSTIAGCNTRRYHGLLVGPVNPPADRVMALSNCIETFFYNGQRCSCSTCEFDGKFSPRGIDYIKSFYRDTGIHFDFEFAGIKFTKSIYLVRGNNSVILVYEFKEVGGEFEFELRPFVGLRDFHSLQKSSASLCAKLEDNHIRVHHNVQDSCQLVMKCKKGTWHRDEQWWYDFLYRNDKSRGQDYKEDLWTAGYFKCSIKSNCKVVFSASLFAPGENYDINFNVKEVIAELSAHKNSVLKSAKAKDKSFENLVLAADNFIITKTAGKQPRNTILAGFPWFLDWGRDAFISLPGLLLCTGREQEAKNVLTAFADEVNQGMIPNRFDDRNGNPSFNSIDASLWFVNAAFEYLNHTGDKETFEKNLLGVIRQIVKSYEKGTRFGIHADNDGLITGGNEDTQLTWMDARCNGISFTPRYGKAVEINALWYNCLCWLGQYYTDIDVEQAAKYHAMADKVEESFIKTFWNEALGYLNDCVFPDGTIDDCLRPNQIFAVSLPFSPLSPDQQKSIMRVIEKHLLTPYGLRTLSPDDPNYKGMYVGGQFERDQAYHQGTVWPFLIGPFIDGFLKVNNFDYKAKKKAAQFLEPLILHMSEEGCLGSISEIFDGDSPHQPRGCFAQAWSVAEVIRAYKLIAS